MPVTRDSQGEGKNATQQTQSLRQRIAHESGAYAPSRLVAPGGVPDAGSIEDGGGYGDPLPETRPDFVREDDRRR